MNSSKRGCCEGCGREARLIDRHCVCNRCSAGHHPGLSYNDWRRPERSADLDAATERADAASGAKARRSSGYIRPGPPLTESVKGRLMSEEEIKDHLRRAKQPRAIPPPRVRGRFTEPHPS